MKLKISDAAEVRERVEDGELIPISVEDKRAAMELAYHMGEVLVAQPTLHCQLAVEMFSVSVVERIAGPDWAKALKEVFKQIPIED